MYTQQISVYCIPIDPDALTTPPPPPKLDELWHDAPPPLGTPDPSPSIHPENPISPLSVALSTFYECSNTDTIMN